MAAKKTTAAKKSSTASRSKTAQTAKKTASKSTGRKTTTRSTRTGSASSAKRSLASKQNTKLSMEEIEHNEKLNREVRLWATLAISLLFAVSIFGYGGPLGTGVRYIFFGFFGSIAYFIPFLIAGLVFFAAANDMSRAAAKRMEGAVLLVIGICVFISLFENGSAQAGAAASFTDGVDNHCGGGLIGGLFASGLVSIIGLIGAYIIDIAAMIIAAILITGKAALISMNLDPESRKAAAEERKKERELIREIEAEKRQEEHEKRVASLEAQKEKAQEKRKKRFANKAQGINLGATDITGEARSADGVSSEDSHVGSDDMKELNIHMFNEDDSAAAGESGDKTASLESDKTAGVKEQTEETELNPEEFASAKRPLHIRKAEEINTADHDAEDLKDKEPVNSSDVKIHAQHLEQEPNPHTQSNPYTEPNTYDTDPLDKIRQQKEEAMPSAAPVKKARSEYKFPTTDLLAKPKPNNGGTSRESLMETADKLENVLRNFGVNVKVTDVSCGPAVTRFEIQPEVGVKVSRIVNLADDIKLNLAASDIRIEAPIPGKAAVGIEVPNKTTQMVPFRELVESREFIESRKKSPIAFAAGRDIAGHVVISDIAKMPHLLIAGATGSGKSVCINTIIMSILYRAHPDDVKFIMIDPKVVELSVYNGIPHLLTDVVTDPKKAAGALQWAVKEMTNRYNKFAQAGVRDMKGYNAKIKNGKMKVHVNGKEMEVDQPKLPQIVVIVDELADLMMVASSEVEEAICRLAQLARAAGIHLIIATQRPSVNVITGLIKANMPSRIAFSVTSGVDSRTILDMVGAEKLLGKGDMLYYPQGFTKPLRVQGAFVSDDEVQSVVDFLRENNESNPEEKEEIAKQIQENEGMIAIDGAPDADSERDAYFADAGRLIVDKEKGSIGMLQRYFKVGFNRAARIMDQLEEAGVVGPEEGTKPRRVLMSSEQFEQMLKG